MSVTRPFNFKKWIDENRHLLKPPVNNKVVYKDAEFIVMVVGGPNSRKDYHYNESEEFFYQLEGDIKVIIQEDGKAVEVDIKEGDIFLLPPKIPHNPIRFKNTIGLVMEKLLEIERQYHLKRTFPRVIWSYIFHKTTLIHPFLHLVVVFP